jgi:hypothetical protein
VVIVFGDPLSDWKTISVEMCEKTRVESDTGNSILYMVGYYSFPKKLIGKTIPYKYVLHQTDTGLAFWESIYPSNNEKIVNRCLIVPSAKLSFAKYDDCILLSNHQNQRSKGRSFATAHMLPQSVELDDPKFDFLAALERFEQVVKAHGPGGSKICIDGKSKPFDLAGYDEKEQVRKYIEHLLGLLRTHQKEGQDKGKLLRIAVYICMITSISSTFYQFSLEDYGLIFQSFYDCSALLFQASILPEIGEETRTKICDVLKRLVIDFVARPTTPVGWKGRWIYAIPFIHHWDLSERADSDWLNLRAWKSSLYG